MFKMKKLFFVILTAGSLVATNITVFASEPTYNDKQLFVDNILATKEIEQTIDSKTQNDINEVVMKYISNDIEGALEIINGTENATEMLSGQNEKSTYEILEDYLNSNNAYIYSYETVADKSRSVGSTDVQMNSVMIVYDANDDTWSVTGGGYWITTNYLDDAPNPSAYAGAKNVGGVDAVGFVFTNVSGDAPALKSSSGYVHDGHGSSTTLLNPCTADSAYGLMFEFQDQIYFSEDLSDTCYMGYGYAGQGIYNSDFADYNGFARSYYAHTWGETSISSIGLNKTGISISWIEEGNNWVAYTNSDRVF